MFYYLQVALYENLRCKETMSLSKKSLLGGLVGAIIAVSLIVGVGYFSAGLFGGSNTGTVQLSMIDPPNVPSGITHVYITYTSIQVHVANGGNASGWYNVTSSGQIDLMSITSASQVLGSAKLPTGNYNIVRFNITSATVTLHTPTADTNYPTTLPNGRIQVTITGGGVSVKAGATSAVLVDISPKVTGDSVSGYTLVPSATAQPTTPK
jgi:hypothetical protein